jgi:beta-glucanase (GH16 family)
MRAKLPKGPGTWPAFWIHSLERVTHAADKSRTFIEIDILEQYGHWPSKHCTAIHQWRRDNQPSIHEGGKHLVSGMDEDFHTYGCMVTEEFITFYFDGVQLRRDKTPECGKVPLYVMVDLALGPGWPLDQTPDPSYMYVDYVRVYAKK